jgi:hypothetical protein
MDTPARPKAMRAGVVPRQLRQDMAVTMGLSGGCACAAAASASGNAASARSGG